MDLELLDSIEYSWKFVTADELLCHGPCELISAFLSPSAASTVNDLYNGEDAGGERIIRLEAAVQTGLPFTPPVPIYCSKGLFVDFGTGTTGILVQWRKLG